MRHGREIRGNVRVDRVCSFEQELKERTSGLSINMGMEQGFILRIEDISCNIEAH